jgi:hypothetical protein
LPIKEKARAMRAILWLVRYLLEVREKPGGIKGQDSGSFRAFLAALG